ncbi:hypothetical protein [Arthrobacter sp. Ld5]|uniref:hypothetical protein n=1 Tax=Arthrobacter sp. Ld5 TaxID=649152 RepID=UPI003EC02DD3
MAILVGAALSAVLAAINALQLQSLERALGGIKTPDLQRQGTPTTTTRKQGNNGI